MTAALDPARFGWEHFGRHMDGGSGTGDPRADLDATFGREHPHYLADEDRVLVKLASIRTGASKETVSEWACAQAAFSAGHSFLATRSSELSTVERDALSAACATARTGKLREMRGTRLGPRMHVVIREDAPSLLVSNVRPACPDRLDWRLCHEQSFQTCLRELLVRPPGGIFAVIRFEKRCATWSDISLNLSARRIRIGRGHVDRDIVLGALDTVAGLDWKKVDHIARLASARDADISRAGEIDAEIELLATALDVASDDLLEVLPNHGSADWEALKTLATSPETDDAGDGS